MKLQILAVLLLLFTFNLRAVEPEKPNILFILADDLGYSDVGFSRPEQSSINDIVSPNLDRLAEGGTIFTAAYAVHPFCGPSRAGIMTGRYPHCLGAQFNLAAFTNYGVDKNEQYFSELLKQAGYFTGFVGKWHLGEVEGYRPNDRGFDEFFGFLGGGHRYFSDDYASAQQSRNMMENYRNDPSKAGSFDSYRLALMHNNDFVAPPDSNEYLTDRLTREGIAMIDEAQSAGKPFFLFMSYNAPHTLLEAKDSDIETLKKPPYNLQFRTEKRATYAAMIFALDKQVQLLVDSLKAKGLFENTLIVFMSDNGGKGPDPINGAYNSPLRGKKGDVYEGGYRVPMFIHWPTALPKAPAVYPYVVSGLDLYPTFVHLAGGTIPEGKVLNGKDLLPAVGEEKDVRPNDPLFALRIQSPNNYVAIRQGKWKAVSVKSGSWELYDIENDISELHPVNNQPVLDSLVDFGAKWVRSHIDPIWFDKPSYGFEEKWNRYNMPGWERTFPGFQTTAIPSFGEDETSKMNVYPNPAKLMLNMTFGTSLADKVDVALVSMEGHLIQLMSRVKPTAINMLSMPISPSIPEGNYVVAVQSDGKTFNSKIYVER